MLNSRTAIKISVALFFLGQSALANVGQTYGFGARSAALAGAVVAGGFDGFAAYDNPAGLGLVSDKRMQLSYALIYVQPIFTPINGIIIENGYGSDKASAPTTGNVDLAYRATFGQTIGLSYSLFPSFYNLSLGIVVFFPLQSTAYMDTGETFVPEYFMYRARTQRPQIEFALGADLGKGFHVGLGAHVGFALSAASTLILQTDATASSQMRFQSSLQAKAMPYFGFLYTPPEDPGKYSMGGALRLPLASDATIALNSGFATFGGSIPAIDLIFAASSALYYDPLSIEIGGSYRETSNLRTFAQLDYQFWSLFVPPLLNLQNTNIANCTGAAPCGASVTPTKVPSFTFRNTLVPRLGQEYAMNDQVTVRGGYSYVPAVLSSLNTGAGNYLDVDKHSLNLGLGFLYKHFLVYEVPTRVDFNLTYQYLVPQHVTKTAGDENGNATLGPKVGTPGYDVGGNVIGGGVSLSMAF